MEKRNKSAVLRTRRLSGKMLRFLIDAEDETLREFAGASKTGRAGKTLVKQGPLRITLVAIKKGTTLPPHQVAGPVSIQILRGCLELTTDKGAIDLPTGSLVTLQAGLTHAARARDDSAILITFAMP
jgi:quercetin dioxygenase-like cupin family protein